MAGPTLALYRRYRPETFEDVIGQEHVTAPLRQALRTGRVNHAYLFSGPRGCGKTTSARILARCLNCAGPDGQATGPTDTPCGVCPSCVELARGGPGSLDVVEIDAASHGGVDDARELRERATFAPARDRYKVFVVDEAHMVSPQGFNALLKLVEEPPEHVMFVFATTEPDKVLGTIRSRTHHYPFHLVPPEPLQRYLEELCAAEGVDVGKGVLPLVVRAGGGSVRDSLSVLDQLVAGADESGVDYERAISLLGYTHASLLDDVVDALAAGDGGAVFRVVDRVIGSGHDPRRFVEDLLERLRDLVVVRAVGEGARSVLRTVPEDQLQRMRGQADALGAAELSRAADVTNAALTEMVGATSPRLHLELLCARLLLPVADVGDRGLGARLDRLERRLGVPVTGPAGGRAEPAPPVRGEAAAPPADAPPADAPPADASARDQAPGPGRADATGASPSRGSQEPAAAAAVPTARRDGGGAGTGAGAGTDPVGGVDRQRSSDGDAGAPAARRDAPVAPEGGAGGDVDTVRRMWPDVLERVGTLRRATWSLLSQHARVHEVSGGAVRLAFSSAGLAETFSRGPSADVVRRALVDVLGLDLPVVAVVAGGADGGDPGGARDGGPARGPTRGPTRGPLGDDPPAAPPSRPSSTTDDDWPEPATPGGGRTAAGAAEHLRGASGARPDAPAGREAAARSEDSRGDDGATGTPETTRSRGAGTGRDEGGPRGAASRAGGDGGPPVRGRRGAGQPGRAPAEDPGPASRAPAPPSDWDDLPPAEPPDEDAPPEPDDAPARRPAPRTAPAEEEGGPPAPVPQASSREPDAGPQPGGAREPGEAPQRGAVGDEDRRDGRDDEDWPEPVRVPGVAEVPPPVPGVTSPTGEPASAVPGASSAALTGAAAARAAAAASRRRPGAAPAPTDVPSAGGAPAAGAAPDPDDQPSRDDADAEDEGLVGARLVEQVLGGRVIDGG
ncbi:DNA polymerase III subunit gamma and tau [Pseudokineococcus basanitobsidens]|uniref:DNA-directed DNA polymerase n=1 Tax=Pseudokineococcus basanitobsidens TaxID=1926649 RepID=A0ABU8RK51_9ACTN